VQGVHQCAGIQIHQRWPGGGCKAEAANLSIHLVRHAAVKVDTGPWDMVISSSLSYLNTAGTDCNAKCGNQSWIVLLWNAYTKKTDFDFDFGFKIGRFCPIVLNKPKHRQHVTNVAIQTVWSTLTRPGSCYSVPGLQKLLLTHRLRNLVDPPLSRK